MANKDYNFQYTPLTGRLPGNSFVKQTEQAINELAGIVNEGAAQVEVITNLANQANDNSEEALEKATEALETSGRVYITLPNLDDADDYFDSQLYYFANSHSANLPVVDTGFLEVKTNDTKTAAEQVFVSDTTGLMYMRHGVITSEEVGSETVYSVTWETWSSALASESYVQEELLNYLSLSGGIMTGRLTLNDQATLLTSKYATLQNNYSDNGGYIAINGGNGDDGGSRLVLYGQNYNGSAADGGFYIRAKKENISKVLSGRVDGTLTWDGMDILPAGIVQAFAGTTIPNGWLLCDGSAVSRTTYANLFAVIGTTYGAGDGSTTFNLPNLVDKFIEGSSTAGTVKSAGLPNIEAHFEIRRTNGNALTIMNSRGAMSQRTTSSDDTSGIQSGTTGNRDIVDFYASNSNTIYGNSTTVQPPALTMKYIIKY